MENERLKQGDTVALTITGTGTEGEGVGRVGNFVVFVPYALPGEEITARITYVKKNFANAVLKEVTVPSANRVAPPCNRFGRCGGCAFLNLKYEAQLQEKRNHLIMTLKKTAGYVGEAAAVVPSQPLAYRNKMQLPFGMTDGKVSLGFYQNNTHKVVSIGKCFLHGEWAERLISILKEWANEYRLSVYTDENKTGLLRHAVARYVQGKLCLTLVVNEEKLPFQGVLIAKLNEVFPNVSVYLNVNREDTNVVFGDRLIPLQVHSQRFEILGINVTLHPFSFLQINDAVRDSMYLEVLKIIRKNTVSDTEQLVIDAYAGVGILGAILAKEGAYIWNLEIVPEATRDADVLAADNGVGTQVQNKNGDSAVLLPGTISEVLSAHPGGSLTVLLDPPRKGCDRRILDALNAAAEVSPLEIIYISCNPATLARDLVILQEHFTVQSVQPFDMFPNTPHIECLVCLTRNA